MAQIVAPNDTPFKGVVHAVQHYIQITAPSVAGMDARSGALPWGADRAGDTAVVHVEHQMRSGIRDMLGDFGEEIQRTEHLEFARPSGQQFLVGRLGKASDGVVLRLVDHLPGLGHLDHPRLGEGTPQEILDQALHSFLITGFESNTLIDTAPGVSPRAHISHHLLGDLALCQEQPEDLLLPELEQRFGRQLRQREKCAAGQEHPFAHQSVDVWVRMKELAEGLDGADHARHGVGRA